MASGSDYVSTLNGVIFAPWRAWKLANREFVQDVKDLLDTSFPKGSANIPAVGDLAQILQNAVVSRELTPAPILERYSTTDDFSLSSQDSKEDKIGVNVGVNITAIPVTLGITGSHEATSGGSTSQAHHVACEVSTPLPEGDPYQAAAANWLRLRELADAPAAPAAPAKPTVPGIPPGALPAAHG